MKELPPFRILMVCTGNIYRSPVAERVIGENFERLAPGRFQVSSAGTAAMAGSDMTPQAAGLARVFGARAEEFAARQLSLDILSQQNLVLTMTRQQRSEVVEIAPALLRKTFTLREFTRILAVANTDWPRDPHERWTQLVSLAGRLRSQIAATIDQDDVIDPYGQPEKVHERMTKQLTPALQTLLDWELHNR